LEVVNDHHLEKEYRFEDFREALEFTNRVGALAEAKAPPGHLPGVGQGQTDDLHPQN
jgi:4a-hydroxytetrahydrobiopterin dehydratase